MCIFAFDLLYLNGESLIERSFRKRRELLYEYFPAVESKLMHAVKMDSNNLDSIQEFLDHSIRDGCEGLMVKTLDHEAHYEISKRSHNWLKLKKDYLEGVGDVRLCPLKFQLFILIVTKSYKYLVLLKKKNIENFDILIIKK